jgi:mRNA-degrading endonuclease toxin of MazEF toxin-antitoxin module
MPSYSRGDVILVPYPFSDLSSTKVRPAIVVSKTYPSNDVIVVPLTSRTGNLLPGEFVLQDWKAAGLNVVSAVKRGLFLTDTNIIQYRASNISDRDMHRVETSLRFWLGL